MFVNYFALYVGGWGSWHIPEHWGGGDGRPFLTKQVAAKALS